MSSEAKKLKLALMYDYPEEGWVSMDICARELDVHLRAGHGAQFEVTKVLPQFKRAFGSVPLVGRKHGAFNADRLVNRFVFYPRHVRSDVAGKFDFYHIADHSYAALAHELPPKQTGIFCHDLDAYRCLLRPDLEPRPKWFKAMARRILKGLQRAEVVFHLTDAVRDEIVQFGLLDPRKLVKASVGVTPAYFENVPLPAEIAAKIGARRYVLHVGSTIPRKRIDVLLQVFAKLREKHKDLVLVKVAKAWTPAQAEMIEKLGIGDATILLSGLETTSVAALYRGATLVLQPSEAEGFGMPVAEALAAGAAVIASDIPVLREVGGDAVAYCPVGDVAAWTAQGLRWIEQPGEAPNLEKRLARARLYTWEHHADVIANAYLDLAAGRVPSSR